MKKLCSTILCVAMLLSLLSISGYATSVNSERNILYDNIVSSVSPNVEVEVLEEIPDGIVPLSFDSWEDAVQFINSVRSVVPYGETTEFYSPFPDENYVAKGDIGRIGFYGITSRTGSKTFNLTYDVPGLSAQTITANHYFEYKSGRVTDWSVNVNISGIGFSSYTNTYKKLERHDLAKYYRYFGVCVGNFGIYINVGGVPIGAYLPLELTQVLYSEK